MHVQVVVLRDEISNGGRHGPTAGTSGQTARLDWPKEKSERLIVATKAVTRLERRSRTWLKRTAKRRRRR